VDQAVRGSQFKADARILALYPLVFAGLCILAVKSLGSGFDPIILERFAVTTLSILVEALPFLLLGSLVSAVIHLYVSEELIARLIPKSRVIGALAASLMGFVFPLCECGIVPVVRGLMKKGAPLHVGITFMLAVPMVNPLVLASTWLAFIQFPQMVLFRGILGLAAAVTIGLVLSFLADRRLLDPDVLLSAMASRVLPASGGHHHDGPADGGPIAQLKAILPHAAEDFFEVGRYFFLGVILSSMIQVLLPDESLRSIGHSVLLSVVVMIGAAYVLSVCSEADAFIARAFMSQFSTGALVAFLIFGPMMDLKNTLMLSTAFRGRFILLLIGAVALVSAIIGIGVNLLPSVFALTGVP